jgi:hypothetical protein
VSVEGPDSVNDSSRYLKMKNATFLIAGVCIVGGLLWAIAVDPLPFACGLNAFRHVESSLCK